jgi:hypothetical protein
VTAVIEPTKKAAKRKAPAQPKVESKPGDLDYDWSTEYPDEPFTVYTTEDGVTVGLASGKGRLKPGDFRKMSKLQDWQATFYMIEKVASPAALAVSDEFDDDEYAAMMKAWTEWSGTTSGESSAP